MTACAATMYADVHRTAFLHHLLLCFLFSPFDTPFFSFSKQWVLTHLYVSLRLFGLSEVQPASTLGRLLKRGLAQS